MKQPLVISAVFVVLAATLVFSIIGAVRDRPGCSPVVQMEHLTHIEQVALQRILGALHQLSDERDMVPAITHANDPCQEDEALWWLEPGRRNCVAIDTICGN